MASYISIDLNDDSTTTVFDPDVRTEVGGVHMANGGTSAVAQLEVTDGSDTVVLTPGQTAGDPVDFSGPILVGQDDSLQINVTTAEGSSESSTAVVTHE